MLYHSSCYISVVQAAVRWPAQRFMCKTSAAASTRLKLAGHSGIYLFIGMRWCFSAQSMCPISIRGDTARRLHFGVPKKLGQLTFGHARRLAGIFAITSSGRLASQLERYHETASILRWREAYRLYHCRGYIFTSTIATLTLSRLSLKGGTNSTVRRTWYMHH